MRYISLCVFTFFISMLGAQQEKSPKLIIGIVVDQMCYDYLYRYYDRFGENGFKKLMNKGTNCRNTKYNYLPTYTGPGHASIYTGTTPDNHGIVANDWFDKTTRQSVNCVEDSLVTPIGTISGYGLFSPKNLKVNTITDQLKLTYPKAKVISMSIKNRGAILPGGHLSDGSYWYDFASGEFITSSFFASDLPNWVKLFNSEKHVANYMGKTWKTYYPIETYTASGPDDSPYERLLKGKSTPTFPYDLKEMTGIAVDYDLFTYTPFANTFLNDFAMAAIENEKLGQDNQTDMLCISFSTPDIAGHEFGPYSIEIEDMYIRLDIEIAKLISSLEEQVGENEFTLFLTADHAVVPVPQYLIDKKLPGGYFIKDEHIAKLRKSILQEYGDDFVLAVQNNNIYLDHDQIKLSTEFTKTELIKFVINEVSTWDHVKRVYSGTQLYLNAAKDNWMSMVKNGYHHEESGDVIFILEPGYLPKVSDVEANKQGTSHGSAFNYDTHVPLLWYGKNIRAQELLRSISITDIAATLAHLMYLQMPSALTGSPILELLED